MTSLHRPSPLDRALRPFADVRAGEGVVAVLLALNVFLILTTCYILKPVREALILGPGSHSSAHEDAPKPPSRKAEAVEGRRSTRTPSRSCFARRTCCSSRSCCSQCHRLTAAGFAKLNVLLAAAFLGVAVFVGRAHVGRKERLP